MKIQHLIVAPLRNRGPAAFLATLISLGAGGILGSGCRGHSPNTAADDTGDPAVHDGRVEFPTNSPQLGLILVKPAVAVTRTSLRLNGRLVWDENATARLFSPFAGRVTRIAAEVGETVTEGSPLAYIASADFGQAETEARRATTDLALADRNLSRIRELSQHGAAPQKDVSAAEADYDRALAEAERTQARLALFDADATRIDNAFILRAPFTGVVVEKNLNPGSDVRPDQMLASSDRLAAPLFTVTDPARLWVLLDVAETDAGRLLRDTPLRVRTAARPGEEFAAKVVAVSDSLDPATRTVRVRAALENPARRLKAEMLVSVVADLETPGVVAVPPRSVYLRGDRHFLFAEVAPGTFVRREVKVVGEQDGQVRVQEGVQPNDRVVADGALLLEQLLSDAETS